jgi:hypothetical protein
MRKAFLSITTTVVMAAGGAVATAPSASADTENCVTRSEYRRVDRGTPKSRVHRIFDIDGKRQAVARSGGYVSEIRSYRTCSEYSAVSISYEKRPGGVFRLAGKSAIWVG